jgi:hypothetical protein
MTYRLQKMACWSLVWLAILLAPLEAIAALSDRGKDSSQAQCRCSEGSQSGWRRACRAPASDAGQPDDSASAVVAPRTSYDLINSADQSASTIVFGKRQPCFVCKEAAVVTSASERCALLCRQLR